MKKTGFTLAEVLITLGIVGVVSALVLPTFTTKMQTAKVGPRLAKSVSAFEQANIAILNDAQADALTGAIVDGQMALSSPEYYFSNVLPTHMKGSYNSTNGIFYAADGAAYCLAGRPGTCEPELEFRAGGSSPSPHLNYVTSPNHTTSIMIDIDGDNGPNTMARDRFYFQMMDDGSLRPWGGSWEEQRYRWNSNGNCPPNASPRSAFLCAGHVMENGLKVEYK